MSPVRAPAGPKGKLDLRIFRPAGNRSVLPVVMYFHGGGWVLGDVETYDRFVREIVNGSGAAVVFVEYDRAPEERYPVAVEECYAATQWVVDHANEIRVLHNQIAVAGDSAGGNIATAVTMLAKQRGGPRIAAQVLIYPATTATFDTPSFEQFADGYFLTRDATRVSRQDHERLRTVGFNDRAILQITLIASWFNYINRVADALGVGRD